MMYCAMDYHDYDRAKDYKVRINAYHVSVTRDGKVVFARETPADSGWYDKDHQALTKAIDGLERALAKIVKEYDRNGAGAGLSKKEAG